MPNGIPQQAACDSLARWPFVASSASARLLQRALFVDRQKRAHLVIHRHDPVEAGLGQLKRGDLTARQQVARGGDG